MPAVPGGNSMEFAELTVLVVEDHDFQRRMAVRLLKDLGVENPGEAVNGRDALARLAEGPAPDIVITDLDMPEMDGIELIRHIAEQHLARAVVIASGLDSGLMGSVEQMARAYGLQVLGNVEKPLSRERLANLVRQYRRGDDVPDDAETVPSVPTVEEIGQALTERRFSLAFQPLVEFGSGRLTGAEVLVRWQRDPGAALLLPDQIVPELERQGRISELSQWILEQAAQQSAEWEQQGLPLSLSVNISMLDLQTVETADAYAEAVRARGADPRQFTLELTETRVMAHAPQALNVLSRLRLKGFGLAIDDFGTGFSSLAQLSQIPFTELKIDRSFVANCDRDARRRSIVESSLDLARRLRLKTVAEGVQTRDEWKVLKSSGCERAQGWLIAKAMPAADFAGWALNYEPPAD